MQDDWLIDGPRTAEQVLILAHGAGQPMDSEFLRFFAVGLAADGWRVIRFNFPYMITAKRLGGRRPPDRQPVLLEAWKRVIARVREEDILPHRLILGGKSLGGRMATMLADEQQVGGLVCLGYPFHPPGRASQPRIDHLQGLRTPTLICQGTRDPFGTPDEVAGYSLSPAIELFWVEDGEHSFKPSRRSRRSWEQNLAQALGAIRVFLRP